MVHWRGQSRDWGGGLFGLYCRQKGPSLVGQHGSLEGPKQGLGGDFLAYIVDRRDLHLWDNMVHWRGQNRDWRGLFGLYCRQKGPLLEDNMVHWRTI